MFAIRELYASMTATAAVSAASIFWLHFSRFTTRGTLWWGFAMLGFFTCMLFISLRGSIPNILSFVFSNIAAIWGYLFIWYGIRAYLKRPLTYAVLVAGIIATMTISVGFYWFTYITPFINARIALFCFVVITLDIAVAYELLYHARKSRTAKLIALNNIINSIILAVRGGSMFIAPDIGPYFSSGWQTVLFLLWSNISLLITTFGLIMMMVEDLNTKLEKQAIEDPLTGLFNRRALHAITPQEFLHLQNNKQSLGLLMLDIDHFKRVNDTYGHTTGDALLQHFAGEVSSCLRASDAFYRIGGEEFLIVVPNSSGQAVFTLGERIREHIEHTPFTTPNEAIYHTVSIGCSLSNCHDCNFESVLERADTALYAAKSSGRNRVLPYSPSMSD